jgi:hypothetical protein
MAYEWEAEYNDGTSLKQAGNAYHDIDQSRLRAFLLVEGETPRLRIEFNPGERLVWRRRVERSLDGSDLRVCHIVGKRVAVADGLEVSSVACIFEDTGELLTADGFDDNHPWLYAPQYLEHE